MHREDVAERVAHPRHGGDITGAPLVGQSFGEPDLIVQIGLWPDGKDRVTRARWKATTCAALMAYADVACELLEAGTPPSRLTGRMLRARLPGVHHQHYDRAELVVRAIRSALEGASP